MARYISSATTLRYTPTASVSAGDVVVLSDLVTVATHDIPADALGAVAYHGEWEIAKGSDTIAQGDAVYWDATASQITTTATANTFAGHASAAASSSDSKVSVLLNV